MLKPINYKSDSITVTYDVKKCIHAAECVHGNSDVFDPKRKPWVEPANGDADDIVAVINKCPSGALQYVRHDGGAPEAAPDKNTVSLDEDGPIAVRGDVTITNQAGEVIEKGTRFTLCRCGLSANKPFCDNSHQEKFSGQSTLGEGGIKMVDISEDASGLAVTVATDGPLLLSGPVTLLSSEESDARTGLKSALCRCGHSNNKPFCDGSHRVEGFEAA